jgi:hypothetical protein
VLVVSGFARSLPVIFSPEYEDCLFGSYLLCNDSQEQRDLEYGLSVAIWGRRVEDEKR